MSLSDNFKVDSNGNGTFKGTVKIENGNSTANLSSATISKGTIKGGTFGSSNGGPSYSGGSINTAGVTSSDDNMTLDKHYDKVIANYVDTHVLKADAAFTKSITAPTVTVTKGLYVSGTINVGGQYGSSKGISGTKAGISYMNGIITKDDGKNKADTAKALIDDGGKEYTVADLKLTAADIKSLLGVGPG
jgi:hypothetical protein